MAVDASVPVVTACSTRHRTAVPHRQERLRRPMRFGMASLWQHARGAGCVVSAAPATGRATEYCSVSTAQQSRPTGCVPSAASVRRRDIKIIVMSATLDAEKFQVADPIPLCTRRAFGHTPTQVRAADLAECMVRLWADPHGRISRSDVRRHAGVLRQLPAAEHTRPHPSRRSLLHAGGYTLCAVEREAHSSRRRAADGRTKAHSVHCSCRIAHAAVTGN